jgi:hypothetical protein
MLLVAIGAAVRHPAMREGKSVAARSVRLMEDLRVKWIGPP